jgi:hypothetical protein
MQPPIASTDDLISLTVGALSRLMAGHEMAAASGQVRPCECDVCVSIRAVRAARAAQCPDPETKSRILLRQWPSPEQLTQYKARGAFEVVGSKTGKRGKAAARYLRTRQKGPPYLRLLLHARGPSRYRRRHAVPENRP